MEGRSKCPDAKTQVKFIFLGLILSPDPGSWVQLDLGEKTGEKIFYFQQTDIEKLFLHPQYNKNDNDIAIIRLKQ